MGNEIVIGESSIYDDQILSGEVLIEDALATEELRIDTLSATIDSAQDVPTIFQPSDSDGILTVEEELFGVRPLIRLITVDVSQYSYGQPVKYYHDGNLIGVFYMESIDRVGKTSWSVSCTSSIGLLVNSRHYGGIYTGESVESVLSDIIGGVVEYTLDERLKDIPVYGWLPVGTRRDNLHQLLFAIGAVASKDVVGSLYITVLEESAPVSIDDSRITSGGSVEYQSPASQVLVSEHAYASYSTDAETVLFEGEVAAEELVTPNGQTVTGALVLYDGPMHDVTVENGKILEQGVNYAVLGQSPDCKLTGKAYTHTTRIISASTSASKRALVDVKDNVIRVEEATLVSLVNSENVASRIAAYYASAKSINVGFRLHDERPGDTVKLSDPFDEDISGFISSIELNMSGTLIGNASILSGYIPGDFGNYYSHVEVITDEKDWSVPEGANQKIRAIIIGGGNGGGTGGKGEDGTKGSFSGGSSGTAGAGGPGGSGGKGGKIYVITIPVEAGQVFHAKPGTGGNPGNSGTASTFGEYNSEMGASSETGFLDPFGSGSYGLPGKAGISGGKGRGSDGDGENVIYNGVTYVPGADGANLSEGGYAGAGGFGGGPAAGQNGGDGGDADYDNNGGHGFMDGGPGGSGATGASGSDAKALGSGGDGGNGGGGGGGGGSVSGNSNYVWPGAGGSGGSGGSGGRGANGVILVYW